MPPVIVVTADEARYYLEVCDAWASGEYSPAEMAEQYPGLSRGDACDWAVYGLSSQGWFTLESLVAEFVRRQQACRATVDALHRAAEQRYQVLQTARQQRERAP